MPKVSWLDSVRMPARIHIAEESGDRTLCGYAFLAMFNDKIWTPYRNSRKHGVCPVCIKRAKQMGIDIKQWHSATPERDSASLPASSIIKQRIRGNEL